MKRIFLTGASSGIGRATAAVLLNQGHEVWGTSRDLARLPKLERFHPVRLDLRNNPQVEEAFEQALAEAGSFDVVVNNAGSGHFSAAEFLSQAEIADQFQVLVFAQIRLLQLALAQMRQKNSGLIINVTSLASRLPVPFMSAYNASKAALAIYSMTIQLELPSSGIRIVDLQPADICTEFNDAVVMPEPDRRYTASLQKAWRTVDRNLKNAPKPELVAASILKLIDDPSPPRRITVGNFFQAKIAPLIFRFLPQRLRVWGLKNYYGI